MDRPQATSDERNMLVHCCTFRTQHTIQHILSAEQVLANHGNDAA